MPDATTTNVQRLVQELRPYRRICFYPSSGTDLGDLDFFGSGMKPWAERIDGRPPRRAEGPELPDLYIHAEINFYQEFEGGLGSSAAECGLHGPFEVLAFRELPPLDAPNRIHGNYPFSGRCFEYRLRVWGAKHPVALLYCLCENEFFVSKVLLDHGIRVPLIWSRNWAGGKTYGTWLANILDRLYTTNVYSDWLCVPGRRGEPRNRLVSEHYPELMVPAKVKLVRNDEIRWVDEGAHGWVEAFDVVAVTSEVPSSA